MVLLEFSISPLDKGESLSAYVARAIDIVERSGINYRHNPMGTVLEGEYDQVMVVVRDCFFELAKDCNRISLQIKIDYRKGSESRMEYKMAKIRSILGKDIKTD